MWTGFGRYVVGGGGFRYCTIYYLWFGWYKTFTAKEVDEVRASQRFNVLVYFFDKAEKATRECHGTNEEDNGCDRGTKGALNLELFDKKSDNEMLRRYGIYCGMTEPGASRQVRLSGTAVYVFDA